MLGAIIGLVVLLVRRNVPESPRLLFIHGREREAEKIVGDIEQQVSESTGQELPEPEGEPMTVCQRKTIPLPLILRSVVTLYPRRSILGLSLFIGQAFLYNSILFGFGNLLSLYFHTPSGNTPYYLAVFAAGNFAGALLLSPLFDTVGRSRRSRRAHLRRESRARKPREHRKAPHGRGLARDAAPLPRTGRLASPNSTCSKSVNACVACRSEEALLG